MPLVLGLEVGVRYRVYYWEPTLGIKYDLGVVGRSDSGEGIVDASTLNRKLYDARGNYRGELNGPVWDKYGTRQTVSGDTYQPEAPPIAGDWVLVMRAES